MKVNYFGRILDIADDYRLAKVAFDASKRDMEAITQAAKARIAAEKARDAERLEELERCVEDASRPETVRRIAVGEAALLRSREYSPTDTEAEEFGRAASEAMEAIADLTKLRIDMRAAIEAAKTAIEQMRSETMGDPHSELRQRWVDGCKTEFEQL